ncbi:unknown protein [Cronobacter turicensis z3032]|uniref:Uncharacterized protein n=1 Tax=Cronobacter turicensis (strain DSM 18703 / CCUG 55852 / LMG 23827 / z3032) TaxID=693216 RepID=C9XZH0_CROTZ|nr:unknown protein [Cronobacter turicensis z3032]
MALFHRQLNLFLPARRGPIRKGGSQFIVTLIINYGLFINRIPGEMKTLWI